MTQAAEPESKQLSLFAEIGVETLPAGMADLSGKETRFVLAYLRTGLASTAAREAGYADPEADAAKIRRRPAVAAVLHQAATGAAANANGLAKRVWERSQAYHEELQALRPKIAAERAKGLPTPTCDTDKCRSEYEKRLAFLEQRERFLVEATAKADGLLVQLHAKLEINVSGSVDHNHFVVTPDRLKELAAARREALAYNGN
ncbi:MAG TPA: hypothetical protein VK178_07185 [Opitutaceae bacterium]|nr:hypothetical protein [Opitutaceae bacterium]